MKTEIIQSISCFEKYKSPQTGMIHFYAHAPYEKRHDTIHLGRNFLYILALLKTHNAQEMQEGFRLLAHLLEFQVDGKFPLYLHDYPFARMSSDQIDILVTLLAIKGHYKKVMDEQLLGKLEGAILELASQQEALLRPFDKERQRVILALLKGRVEVTHFEIESSADLSSLVALSGLIDLYFPQENFIKPIFPAYFCFDTQSYCGPLVKEMWYGSTPERTLFHDYMKMSMGHSPEKEEALCQMFYPLIGSLAPLTGQKATTKGGFGVFEKVFKAGDYGFYFTCYQQDFNFKQEGDVLFFELTKPFDPSDSKDPQILFYLNHPELAKVFVEGERALVFYNNEEVTVEVLDKKICLKFEYDSKDVDGVGIVLRGNRPTQLIVDKFSAYDLLIGLRCPRWRQGSLVKVFLQFI